MKIYLVKWMSGHKPFLVCQTLEEAQKVIRQRNRPEVEKTPTPLEVNDVAAFIELVNNWRT